MVEAPSAIGKIKFEESGKKMRILMLSWEYPPHNVGGLGKHVTDLVPALDAAGIEVHLLTPRLRDGEPFTREGTNIYCYRIEPPLIDPTDFFATAWQTNLKLQEAAEPLFAKFGHFDLIHAHDWLVAAAGEYLKHRFHTPLLATIHATERGRGRGQLPGELPRAINNVEWLLTFEAWRIICCSKYMTEEVRDYFNTPLDKIDIIANGVNTTKFDALERQDLSAFRSNYAAPDQKIIFYVGRVVEEKGLRVLIESADKVRAGYAKVKFVIAGTGHQLQEFRNFANGLGQGSHFYFTGFISDEDRDKLYKVADVAVFPSLYEPFGIVALEAMAAEVPVVVADTGGLSEVVTNHETGIVVQPSNPDALAWGILHTLNNADWSATRVTNAYKMVKAVYNWQNIAHQTIATYQRIIEESQTVSWDGVEKD